MANFNEHALEMSIMQLFKEEGYEYISGEQIHRERTDVLLTDDLKQYLYARYAKDGITPSEVDSIILMLRNTSGTLYEANKTIYKMLCDGFIFNREDRTQKDIFIELIDFENPENNIFKAVNQFEIIGIDNQMRIPDGIVFVNGIPVVVLEFKSAVKENTTIMDAYTQLTVRYRRDIPEIFKYNAFVVISDGANNKYGSLFSPYDFFYAWRKVEADDVDRDGINSLVTMMQGLFRKDRLLAVIKDFIYFPDASDKDLKIVCRYPQFFAANKLYENIKLHLRPEGDGKGGTYFGATGCGKSYTMMFLTRMLMKSKFFRSPTILIITDRTDLDDQLSKQFVGSKKYIGDDTVVSIDSREKLRQELQGRESGGVYLTTIQKFTEDLQMLTDRSNVICISDEAHRSQVNLDQKVKITDTGVERTYGFAKYLHDSLPNATYVGFTGTPIDPTIEVFGGIVDSYTMTESVRDGITVNLVYDGRAARVTLDQAKIQEIEDYYAKCENDGANEHQVEESKKAVAENIKTQLENQGIRINLIYASDTQYESYLQNKNYDIILCSNYLGISPDMTTFFGEGNLANYSNEEITQIMNEVKNTTDEKILKEKYEKLEQIYNTQIPYISLANSKYNVLYNSNLVGDVSPNWYNVFYNIEGWYK